ncbi:hypothetical protein B0H66DRAFT_514700 [Apodospora peruviana]|uniref:C2H2-type domain-containing protein n=1 Tax=Apodospora peruviana TaxID=516989 RepID=A0AAE0M8W1_9PEZI|nr:hypothetical protein B0H66DRAFT_514700 [Apodospora peruviana]
MKRKTVDEGLEDFVGHEGHGIPSKRQRANPPSADDHDLAEAETASVFSAADSDTSPTSTLEPAQTAPATSITASSACTRLSRKFPSDLKTIKCTFAGCPKTFNRPARLTAHLRSHTNDRPHRCHYAGCDKSYLEEKHLTQHIKGSHTHEKRYPCEEPGCGKSFVTATRLRRHAAVHEGADRFRCRGYVDCNQSFRKHQTLQRHIRTAHLGQAAYVCGNDGCDSGFDTAGALRRHIAREHGELKFWCDECSSRQNDDDDEEEPQRVGFTTLLFLQAHMRHEHINCMFCDVKCGSQRDLERHIDLHHSGTTVEERKTVVCTWEGCDKRFTRVSNLNTHIKTTHEGLRFVCGKVDTFDVDDISDWNWIEEGCGQTFMSKVKLEEHVRFVHLGRKRPPKLYTVSTTLPEDVVDEMSGAALARDLVCSVAGCAARFARHPDLDRHVEREHGGGVNGADLEENPPLILDDAASQPPVGDEQAWLSVTTDTVSTAPVIQQHRSPTFETEWAEMRRLIDVDALIDKK